MKKKLQVSFEESITDTWAEGIGMREVPLGTGPFRAVALLICVAALIVFTRAAYLAGALHTTYARKAITNASQSSVVPAPRGLIVDRNGVVLADNIPVFEAVLDVRTFLNHEELQDATLASARAILGIEPADIRTLIAQNNSAEALGPVVLNADLTSAQLVALRALNSPVLTAESTFKRRYPQGAAFASLIGYVGLPTASDLAASQDLTSQDTIGKSGVEASYDAMLRGVAGSTTRVRDARGKIISDKTGIAPQPGKTLQLTIDAGLQKTLSASLAGRLADLGRTSGAAVALDPRNGEVLALASFPSYDNNLFVNSGNNDAKRALLASPLKPLFNRAVGGTYSPGSSIKPLEAVAALAEKTITPETTVHSTGQFEIPNPFDPEHPTIIPDEHREGYITLDTAIARSSNTFFLSVGGGGNGIQGLGIDRLNEWWRKFNLGQQSGIDLPGEAKGLLPNPQWKKTTTGRAWLLGDTYNVSIGQGDLALTPLQLADYISTIASGGELFKPHLNRDLQPSLSADVRTFAPQIARVTQAMEQTVQNPLGTTHSLATLPIRIAAKTGTAQALRNTQANAIFAGFAPANDPSLALVVLIENSVEGSGNTIPVARDVFSWFYENRLKK